MASIKTLLKRWVPEGSSGRWILSGIFSHPIGFIPSLLRSLRASFKLTGRYFPIRVRVGTGQRLNINCAPGVKVLINAHIFVNPWGGGNTPSSLNCAEGATLEVTGNFEIGPGVHIEIAKGATLKLGGRKVATGSGITCNSRIMVEEFVEIGADSIIAWDVFISDSDWHDIKGTFRREPISIGDNVWISHGVSILKGATIPSGCIVGAKSLVAKGVFQKNSLIAGVPATVRRTEVEWTR